MYQLVPVPITRPQTLSEEELLHGDDIRSVFLRLGIAAALIAALVLLLDIACNENRPQIVAADGIQTRASTP